MARYKKHIIQQGDTVQNIAQIETGSVHEWQTIVNYNKLSYPYIVSSVQEKMKNPERLVTYGDMIIIPVEASLLDTDVSKLGPRDQELIMSLALGRDLAMTSNTNYFRGKGSSSEILEMSANNKGDIATVAGVENLKQALITRLLTPKGSLLLHPNYGSDLHNMLGMPATETQMIVIENEILSTIKKDGRVESAYSEGSTVAEETYTGTFTVNLFSLQAYFTLVVEGDQNGRIALF